MSAWASIPFRSCCLHDLALFKKGTSWLPVYVSRLSNQVHYRSNIFSDSSLGCLFKYYTITTEETALQVAERVPFEAKWRLLARVGVRCYILISNVSGAVKVAPLQILQFPVVLPHKFQDAEKFNLQFSDFSEITETADKLRWYRYQKGLRQRDVADYAGIDRSTYVHYEEYGKDLYPPEHMEKIAQLFEVPVETLLDMNLVGPNSARNI